MHIIRNSRLLIESPRSLRAAVLVLACVAFFPAGCSRSPAGAGRGPGAIPVQIGRATKQPRRDQGGGRCE